MTRPSWDEYFFELASVVAKRSTCPRLAVGCVLVQDRRVIATGYNGAVRGMAHCTDDVCQIENKHCVRAVHAEVNALLQAARYGVSVENCIAYVTHKPCRYCSMCLTNAGISEVKFQHDY
jgi:dCMP deaminase